MPPASQESHLYMVRSLQTKNEVGIGYFGKKTPPQKSLTLESNPEICGTENSPVKHFERRLYLWRQLTL